MLHFRKPQKTHIIYNNYSGKEPIKWSLHLQYKPLESTLSKGDLIRTVPRGDFARRRWEEPITSTKWQYYCTSSNSGKYGVDRPNTIVSQWNVTAVKWSQHGRSHECTIDWFSNWTGTSVDNGPRKSNNWLDQWLSGKLDTESRT